MVIKTEKTLSFKILIEGIQDKDLVLTYITDTAVYYPTNIIFNKEDRGIITETIYYVIEAIPYFNEDVEEVKIQKIDVDFIKPGLHDEWLEFHTFYQKERINGNRSI